MHIPTKPYIICSMHLFKMSVCVEMWHSSCIHQHHRFAFISDFNEFIRSIANENIRKIDQLILRICESVLFDTSNFKVYDTATQLYSNICSSLFLYISPSPSLFLFIFRSLQLKFLFFHLSKLNSHSTKALKQYFLFCILFPKYSLFNANIL